MLIQSSSATTHTFSNQSLTGSKVVLHLPDTFLDEYQRHFYGASNFSPLFLSPQQSPLHHVDSAIGHGFGSHKKRNIKDTGSQPVGHRRLRTLIMGLKVE